MKIKSIKPAGTKTVVNLTVHKNHNFILNNGAIVSNCDGLTIEAQKQLRGLIEEFSKSSTFVLTCNYKEQLIKPLRNRCIPYEFDDIFKKDKKEIGLQIYNRLKFILDNENIEYDNKDVTSIITAFYPSVREMVLTLQKNSSSGKLIVDQSNLNTSSMYNRILNLAKDKKFIELRKVIQELDSPDSLYTYVFKNLDDFFVGESQPQVILLCAKYSDMSERARDKSITASAFMVELMGNPNIKWV